MVAASNAALHGYAPWFVTRAPPRMGLNANTTHPRRMSRLRFAPKSPTRCRRRRGRHAAHLRGDVGVHHHRREIDAAGPGKVRSTGNHWRRARHVRGTVEAVEPGVDRAVVGGTRRALAVPAQSAPSRCDARATPSPRGSKPPRTSRTASPAGSKTTGHVAAVGLERRGRDAKRERGGGGGGERRGYGRMERGGGRGRPPVGKRDLQCAGHPPRARSPEAPSRGGEPRPGGAHQS